jgi:sialidase-1
MKPFRALTGVLAAAVLLLPVSAQAAAPQTESAAPATPKAAEPQAITQQVLFRRDTNGYDCYRIPAIVKTTKGTLLAFAEARKDAPGQTWCDDQGDIDLVVRRSTDGGATWGPTIMVSQSNGETHGNPVPIVVGSGPNAGRIVLLTTHNPLDLATPRTPYVQYSTADQDGTAWSAPRSVAGQIDDPDWNWSATGPVHGIQLERGPHPGRLIAGINAEPAGGSPLAGIVYSDDGGTNWSIGGLQPGATGDIKPQEISPIELTDGRVYLAARDTQQTGTWPRSYATSSDGGATLDGPFREIANVTATKSVQGSTLRLRATDEGDRYNRILLATPIDPDPATNYRRNLTIYSSYNEGSTWPSKKQITADRSGYSDLVETSSGSIGVLYEAGLWSGDARDEIRFARMAEPDLGLPEGVAGPTTADESGNGLDAYVRGSAAVGAGKYGQSALLDCGEYVQPPYAEALAVGSGDFTVTAWFRYGQSTADQAILWAYGQGSGLSQLWLRAEPSANRVRAWIQTANGSVSVSSTSAYRDEAWHHVSLQRAAGQFVMRIDGVQIGSVAAPAGGWTVRTASTGGWTRYGCTSGR